MRVKTSPNPLVSLPPSTPPRPGPRWASLWALVLVGVAFAADLEGQAVALSATKYGPDYTASASLWFGVQPGLQGVVSYSSGPWIAERTVFSNYVKEYRGRGRGHAWGQRKRYDCRDLFWDPWAWSWAGCGPYWRSAYWHHPYGWVPVAPVWAPYPVYAGRGHPRFQRSRPYYAQYDDDYYDDDGYYDDYYRDDYAHHDDYDSDWSVDVHVSIGHGGSYLYPRYVTWRPVYVNPWYDPWPIRQTIVFVDPGPRWVVRTPPRYVRAEPSPRIGSGGWVTQVGFKESPQGAAPARTAMARPARDAIGAEPTPSRVAPAEPRAAEVRVGRSAAPAAASPEARVRGARPRAASDGATTPEPSRPEPEPTRARARIEPPRDVAPSTTVERRRPEPSATPSGAQLRAEPRARPESQARPQAQPRTERQPAVRAEPRAQVAPRPRAERQPEVRAEPRAQVAPRPRPERQPEVRAAPSRESRSAAPRVEPQRDSRDVRPQTAPTAAREPRSSRPQAAAPSRAGREPQAAPSRPSQGGGSSPARVRPGR